MTWALFKVEGYILSCMTGYGKIPFRPFTRNSQLSVSNRILMKAVEKAKLFKEVSLINKRSIPWTSVLTLVKPNALKYKYCTSISFDFFREKIKSSAIIYPQMHDFQRILHPAKIIGQQDTRQNNNMIMISEMTLSNAASLLRSLV